MGRIDEKEIQRLGLSAQANSIHSQSLVIDLHVDSVIQQRLFGYDLSQEHAATQTWALRSSLFDLVRAIVRSRGGHQPLYNHADIPRMLRGGYSAVALGLHYWPVQSESGWIELTRQLDYVHELVERDARVQVVKTPNDVRDAARQGKLGIFCGVEGAHCLGEGGRINNTLRLDRIAKLYERGVRYLTLAHFSRNDAVAHCFGPGSDDTTRLSPFGEDLVRTMNNVGMIIDVSHVNHPGVMDVCRLSRKPVIATHTGLAGLDPQRKDNYRRRNISDEALCAIAQTGGTIGIIFAPQFLSGKNDNLSAIIRHLRYGITYLDEAFGHGERHFSIGSDFDGWIPSIPLDIHDAADMPKLTARLLDAGFSETAIQHIWGENFLRVWEQHL